MNLSESLIDFVDEFELNLYIKDLKTNPCLKEYHYSSIQHTRMMKQGVDSPTP